MTRPSRFRTRAYRSGFHCCHRPGSFGTLLKVLEIPSEDLFDGVIVKTSHGHRFVDRDQIVEITTEYIKCDLDQAAVAQLPEPSGSPVIDVDPDYGVGNSFREWVHRTFGHGGWKAES